MAERKDTHLRNYLERETGGRGFGIETFGGMPRQDSFMEEFQIDGMMPEINRERIVRA